MAAPLNLEIAQRFDEVADLIEQQSDNPFRGRAYRRAAETLRRTPRSVTEILAAEGEAGLEELEGIGDALARQIRITLTSGRLPILERLRGASDPEALLASVPGIGRKIAERLHHELGIDALEELEAAAHDGRLALLAGFGPKKIAGVIDSLEGRLGRTRRRTPPSPVEPPVQDLLSVDAEYRKKAAVDELKKIAPHRFNPDNRAMAADPPCAEIRTGAHGSVFHHSEGAQTRADPRLGSHLLRSWRRGVAVHGRHRARRRARGQTRGARP